MLDIIMPIGMAVVLVLIFSLIYKNKQKTDKGFTFNYFALSYRRKMIRTAILFPINILLVLLLYYLVDFSLHILGIIGFILLLASLLQLLYNYFMWKKVEA